MTTVLVVDDDVSLRLTVAANLEEEGYVVLEAEDGLQGLEMVQNDERIDLVLSDIRMPRMNGVAAYREIKKARPSLPVVLMTGFAEERLLEEAMLEGVYTVVIKPFYTEHLHKVLRRALELPNVLVVDDDPQALASLVDSLASCHLRSLQAKSSPEAVAKIGVDPVDVAVVDMVMPEEDGLRCAQRLRAADPSVGVILMTGYDVPDMIRAASGSGAVSILRKPFDVRQLVRIIAERRGKPV